MQTLGQNDCSRLGRRDSDSSIRPVFAVAIPDEQAGALTVVKECIFSLLNKEWAE